MFCAFQPPHIQRQPPPPTPVSPNARRPVTRPQRLRLSGSRRPPPSLIFSPGNTDKEARKMSRYRPQLRHVCCKLFIWGHDESVCPPVVGLCLRCVPTLCACHSVSTLLSTTRHLNWSQLPLTLAPPTAPPAPSPPKTPPKSTGSLRSPASLGSWCEH